MLHGDLYIICTFTDECVSHHKTAIYAVADIVYNYDKLRCYCLGVWKPKVTEMLFVFPTKRGHTKSHTDLKQHEGGNILCKLSL